MSSLTFFPQSEVYPFSSIYPQTVSIPVLSDSFSWCPKNIWFPKKKMSSAKVLWYIKISTMQNVLDNEGNNSQQHPLLARSRQVEYWRPKTARPRENCVLNPVEGRVRPQIYPPSPKGRDSEDQMQQGADLMPAIPAQAVDRTPAPKMPKNGLESHKEAGKQPQQIIDPHSLDHQVPTSHWRQQWPVGSVPSSMTMSHRPQAQSLSHTNTHMYAHTGSPQGHMCTLTRCKP